MKMKKSEIFAFAITLSRHSLLFFLGGGGRGDLSDSLILFVLIKEKQKKKRRKNQSYFDFLARSIPNLPLCVVM